MGLFDLFKKKDVARQQAASHSSTKLYFTSRPFSPSGKPIEISFEGQGNMLSQEQEDFFRHIEHRYEALSASIIPLIEDEFRNWKEDFEIKNFIREFEPVHINLPECKVAPVIWELGFESEHDRDHLFTLTMHGDEAKEVLIDG